MKSFLLVLTLLLPSFISAQITGYQHRSIQDFEVYIQSSAFTNNQAKTDEAISLMTSKLEQINNLGLKADILDSLQAVRIFMDWNTTSGAAVYHPNINWLRDNGYIEEKWRSVEISNITNFVNWTAQNQPFMVMHELAHAYHDRVLEFGFSNIPIREAYDQAMAKGLYDNVSYHAGNGNYFNQKAYATTNHIEYFAEITEAFLGENDFFPFVKSELKAHDPIGFELTSDVWQFDNTTNVSTPIIKKNLIYPNPAHGLINIELADINPNTLIRIINPDGRIVREINTAFRKENSIDISDLAAGIYFVSIDNQNYKLHKL